MGVVRFISATVVLPTDLNFHLSYGFKGNERDVHECARNVLQCAVFLTCFPMEWCVHLSESTIMYSSGIVALFGLIPFEEYEKS